MVLIGLQLSLADPLIDPDQRLPGNVLTIIHTWAGDSSQAFSTKLTLSYHFLNQIRKAIPFISPNRTTDLPYPQPLNILSHADSSESFHQGQSQHSHLD